MSSDKLDKKVIKEGNKRDYPQKGDKVTIDYTGWLYDAAASDNQNRGNQQVPVKPHSIAQKLTTLQV